jgi:hypothetical protein
MEKNVKTEIPFWSNDPNILLNADYILELFPTEKMTNEQKLNSISRLIILLTVVSFSISHNFSLIIISAITLFSIYLLHNHQEKEDAKKNSKKIDNKTGSGVENFENNDGVVTSLNEATVAGGNKGDLFIAPSSTNPFGNVLMADYQYNPDKKPAPPAFNANVNNSILDQAKQLVREANPDQPDITDKLFKDFGDQYVFEQSLRQFSSNPITTIPNDQSSFANFCYGDMPSCKSGDETACVNKNVRYTNY